MPHKTKRTRDTAAERGTFRLSAVKAYYMGCIASQFQPLYSCFILTGVCVVRVCVHEALRGERERAAPRFITTQAVPGQSKF